MGVIVEIIYEFVQKLVTPDLSLRRCWGDTAIWAGAAGTGWKEVLAHAAEVVHPGRPGGDCAALDGLWVIVDGAG